MNTFKFWLLYGLSIGFVLAALGCLTLLFCTAQMWLRESKGLEESAPITGRIVQARDARMFVFEEGGLYSPPVVFIHGFGWSGLWAEAATAVVEKDFRAITVDLPPFGFSERLFGPENYSIARQALRLLDVLNALGLKQATLVCHSVSCPVAMELAILKPKLVSQLVLVAPEVGFGSDPSNPTYAPVRISDGMRTILSMKFIRNALVATFGTHPFSISSQFRAQVYNKAVVTGDRVSLLSVPMSIDGTTQAHSDWLEYMMVTKETAYVTDFSNFRRIRAPTLIIWGQQDSVTPIWHGEALRKLLPDAKMKVLPNAGHIPYLEQMNEFTRSLLRFLKGRPLEDQ